MPLLDGCYLCQFFKPTPVGNRGVCRRFPPVAIASQPEVEAHQWCGEFKKDEAKVKAQEK